VERDRYALTVSTHLRYDRRCNHLHLIFVKIY
jgi:hypothetical protein